MIDGEIYTYVRFLRTVCNHKTRKKPPFILFDQSLF